MELFTIVMTNAAEEETDALYKRIDGQLNGLHKQRGAIVLERQQNVHFAEIKGIAAPDFPMQKSAGQVYHRVAAAVADHILLAREDRRMEQLIRKEFAYSDPEDVKKIMQYCHHILYDPSGMAAASPNRPGRKVAIATEIEQHLERYPHLVLEGWMNFRLHAYNNELREVIEYAIDEYLMDKQYQEFISLLKYFVYMQETKIPAVHLMHKGGPDFSLLNEQLKPIDIGQFETLTLGLVDKEINFEDMIVSALITVSPQNIYIHTREPETTAIQTIKQIFEERVTVCEHCLHCQPFFSNRRLT